VKYLNPGSPVIFQGSTKFRRTFNGEFYCPFFGESDVWQKFVNAVNREYKLNAHGRFAIQNIYFGDATVKGRYIDFCWSEPKIAKHVLLEYICMGADYGEEEFVQLRRQAEACNEFSFIGRHYNYEIATIYIICEMNRLPCITNDDRLIFKPFSHYEELYRAALIDDYYEGEEYCFEWNKAVKMSSGEYNKVHERLMTYDLGRFNIRLENHDNSVLLPILSKHLWFNDPYFFEKLDSYIDKYFHRIVSRLDDEKMLRNQYGSFLEEWSKANPADVELLRKYGFKSFVVDCNIDRPEYVYVTFDGLRGTTKWNEKKCLTLVLHTSNYQQEFLDEVTRSILPRYKTYDAVLENLRS